MRNAANIIFLSMILSIEALVIEFDPRRFS
jgi:hypothetical protein